jgi:hypothetical protein
MFHNWDSIPTPHTGPALYFQENAQQNRQGDYTPDPPISQYLPSRPQGDSVRSFLIPRTHLTELHHFVNVCSIGLGPGAAPRSQWSSCQAGPGIIDCMSSQIPALWKCIFISVSVSVCVDVCVCVCVCKGMLTRANHLFP